MLCGIGEYYDGVESHLCQLGSYNVLYNIFCMYIFAYFYGVMGTCHDFPRGVCHVGLF